MSLNKLAVAAAVGVGVAVAAAASVTVAAAVVVVAVVVVVGAVPAVGVGIVPVLAAVVVAVVVGASYPMDAPMLSSLSAPQVRWYLHHEAKENPHCIWMLASVDGCILRYCYPRIERIWR